MARLLEGRREKKRGRLRGWTVHWRRRLGLSWLSLPCPLETLPSPRSCSLYLGRSVLISLSSAGSEGKERERERPEEQQLEGEKAGSMEPLSWNFLPFLPPSSPSQAEHTGLLWSQGEQPDSQPPPSLSSYRIKRPRHLAPVVNLHVICIHLHTPHSRGLQSKDVK